jgi:hypothetical protein
METLYVRLVAITGDYCEPWIIPTDAKYWICLISEAILRVCETQSVTLCKAYTMAMFKVLQSRATTFSCDLITNTRRMDSPSDSWQAGLYREPGLLRPTPRNTLHHRQRWDRFDYPIRIG